VLEAAMTLRPRRNLVLWSQTAGSVGRYRAVPVTRGRRIRRWIRRGALIILIGLMAVGRAAWARRRPLLAAVALIAAGVIFRSGPGAILLLPGLMLLLSSPLMPASSKARLKLERELAAYSTPSERRDLEATLDQYPDDVTRELREILASQARAARRNRIPAFGRR
jgi:hypothetical protein